MIRAGSGSRRCRFDYIQPVHIFLLFTNPTTGDEVARILQRPRMRGKEVGIERKNAICFAEVVDGIDRLTEGHHRAGARIVVVYRLILMPLRLRKLRQNCFQSAPPSVGEVIVSVRKRSPAPCFGRCSSSAVRISPTKVVHGRVSSRKSGV